MIHLLDCDVRIKANDIHDFRANCGEFIQSCRASLQNDWSISQVKPWLDARDICIACRKKSMERTGLRFTYGIVVNRNGGQ